MCSIAATNLARWDSRERREQALTATRVSSCGEIIAAVKKNRDMLVCPGTAYCMAGIWVGWRCLHFTYAVDAFLSLLY